MIVIFSVIIANSNTLELFNDYRALFAKAFEDGKIGVCKWVKSGDTIDTALPELPALVDDKEEWRAVIINVDVDENGDAEGKNSINPFDIIKEDATDDEICESPVPLIRLTQMLGGVPSPDLTFEKQEIEEENMVTRVVYTPVVNEVAEKQRQKLIDKYRFDTPDPEEIVIMSPRLLKEDTREALSRSVDTLAQKKESEFWKRNRYPDICRFVVFDLEYQGNTRRCAEMFEFWQSVLMLTTNHINPSAFQAYRLYRISLVYNKDKMRKSFQRLYHRIKGACDYIDDTIMVDERIRNELRSHQPEYEITVPISVEFPTRTKPEPHKFGVFSEGTSSDLGIWNTDVMIVEDDLDEIAKCVNAAFDRTADSIREVCKYPEDKVYTLSEYQEEEMERALKARAIKVLEDQQSIPSRNNKKRDEMRRRASEVRNAIKLRMTRTTFIGLMGTIAGLLLASNLPLLLYHFSHKARTIIELFGIVVVLLGIYFGTALLVALKQKKKIDRLIQNYNHAVNTEYNNIKDNSNLYTDYMSELASHMRGASFLRHMREETFKKNSLIQLQYTYKSELNDLLNNLMKWSDAHYIRLNTTSMYSEKVRIPDHLSVNSMLAMIISEGPLNEIALNRTGDVVCSQFDFIDRMDLLREDEYEDGR